MLFSSSKHILEEDNMSFFTLKLVALLSMLFDHVTSVWPVSWFVWDLFFPHATETPHIALAIQSLTDYIGRIAAPVFLFFIANGYRYTHSVKQYALPVCPSGLITSYLGCMGTSYSHFFGA